MNPTSLRVVAEWQVICATCGEQITVGPQLVELHRPLQRPEGQPTVNAALAHTILTGHDRYIMRECLLFVPKEPTP